MEILDAMEVKILEHWITFVIKELQLLHNTLILPKTKNVKLKEDHLRFPRFQRLKDVQEFRLQ